jgi:hypothetical protein
MHKAALKMRFWPPLWTDFINDAKLEWQMHLSITDAFPDRSSVLREILSDILNQCLAAYKGQKRKLEAGYYPRYKRELLILVIIYRTAPHV